MSWILDPQLASDSHPLTQQCGCEVRLMDDANYPWLIVVPQVTNVRELFELSAAQRADLCAVVVRAEMTLHRLFNPDKLNVAALGNLVPQLHVHVIARHVGDPAWPAPVWGRAQARPYDPETLSRLCTTLINALTG